MRGPEGFKSPEKRRETFTSRIEGVEGQSEISVDLGPDNKPKAMAFFDIDGTLVELWKPVHGETIARLYEDTGADPDEIKEMFEAGGRLGTMSRELDRMEGIYRHGKDEWRDPKVYERERMGEDSEVDTPGTEANTIAQAMCDRYEDIAVAIVDELYESDPEIFEREEITPIRQLAEKYKRLGIPNAAITANANKVAEALAKYLKLDQDFLLLAADKEMAGGGKEVAVANLIEEYKSMGINVPEEALIFVGDSMLGDIGSLKQLEGHEELDRRGVLIVKDEEQLDEFKSSVANDPDLQEIMDTVDTDAIVVDKIDYRGGVARMGSELRGNFGEKMKGSENE